MSHLAEGSKVPSFELLDEKGQKQSLKTFNADRVVLYFYPKDDTPGCTLEGIEFTAQLKKFRALKTEVVGVSGGDSASKKKFCQKHKLAVKLLADTEFTLAKAFGAYGEKQFMGRKFMGIHRMTFVLNSKTGKIEKAFSSVKPEGHADEVLSFLRGEKSASSEARTVKKTKSAPSKKAKTPSSSAKKKTSVKNVSKGKRN